MRPTSLALGLLLACSSDPGVPSAPGIDGSLADTSTDAPMPEGGADGGAADRFLMNGTIVTPDQVIEGQVLVVAGTITCVAAGSGCAMDPGAAGATVIDTNGIIAPGMIDTHNHILFDVFDDSDWLPSKPYTNHNQWTTEPKYQAMLDVKQCLVNDSQGKPAWCANTTYGSTAGNLRCEFDKWGELKGLIAGTTSIVGLPGTSNPCFGSLARSIDVPQNGLGVDKVQTSATFPPSNPNGVCVNFASKTTDAFLIHCGEGTDATALKEFTTLGNSTPPQCLYAPQTTLTHGVAFTANEFATMGTAGMKLTWSPASNVALYGQTANIPAALDAKVLIALGPDWSMGGSQNMLDELRFADAWDNKNFANRLSSQDLVTMATVNGAKVVALDTKIGSMKKGMVADLVVYSGDRSKPYDAIVAATPKEVRLVMVGGVPLYGDLSLQSAVTSAPCETIDICGAQKFLCVATTTTTSKLNQTYAQIKAAVEQGMIDADLQTPNDGWNFAPVAPLVKCK